MKLQPLGDRIVVKPKDEDDAMTKSGLVIPDTAKEKPQLGEVLAIGPGEFKEGERIPMDISVGDLVFYSKYGGTEVKVEGEDYLILSSRDVLAVLS
jgi:chaperonin GroES